MSTSQMHPREEIFAYFATELFDRKSQEDQICSIASGSPQTKTIFRLTKSMVMHVSKTTAVRAYTSMKFGKSAIQCSMPDRILGFTIRGSDKIYTLGKFDIARDGKVVKFSRKVQQKLLLLLKALIAFRGRDVKEEHLCDALWSDAEGDLTHRSFETKLYRLRQWIGKDNVVQLKEGRFTLDLRSCWVDAFALEKALDEAEGLWERIRRCRAVPRQSENTASQAIQLIRKAITLYRGHFLDIHRPH